MEFWQKAFWARGLLPRSNSQNYFTYTEGSILSSSQLRAGDGYFNNVVKNSHCFRLWWHGGRLLVVPVIQSHCQETQLNLKSHPGSAAPQSAFGWASWQRGNPWKSSGLSPRPLNSLPLRTIVCLRWEIRQFCSTTSISPNIPPILCCPSLTWQAYQI